MAGDYSDLESFPSDWPLRTVGEFADVKGGKRLPAGAALVPHRTSHPYVRIVDFKDGRIDQSDLLYVPDEVFPRIARYTISSKDIYISIVGTIGLIGVIDDELDGANLTENAAKICSIATRIDRDYLAAFLRSGWGQHQIRSLTVGSTQPKLAIFRIADIRVPVPSLAEQRAIAHILGTLDDKIELNRRMSETLEAMARALFKSWFVDFDPVRAKAEGRDPGLPKPIADLFPARLVDSELGEIPEAWEVSPLPDVVEVNPPRALRKCIEAPYLDMANMPTRGHSAHQVVDRQFGSGMRFINGDTLVARITPCLENGKTALVDFLRDGQVGWGSTEYIVLRPKPPLPEEYAYCLARSAEFREFAIQSMTGTSGRQRVPAESLAHFRVVVPPRPISETFGRAIKPRFARAGAAVRESRTLAALRDTLLPKLISGELRIKDAEKFLGRAGI